MGRRPSHFRSSSRRSRGGGKASTLIGVLTAHRDGYGFVSPLGAPGGDRSHDIYIGRRSMGAAMHGDTVKVQARTERGGHRRRGRILEVVERASDTIVGTYRGGAVYPLDDRLTHRVLIRPARVGEAREEDIVLVRITQFPFESDDSSRRKGRTAPVDEAVGEITAVLGKPEDPAIDLPVILHEFQIPESFPDAVQADARELPAVVRESDLGNRRDARDIPVCTIDGETAKDFDDAVYVEQRDDGYRLVVAIADVATYAPLGGALAGEARARGTSVYLPGVAIPMFPEELSHNIASLNPDVDRLALIADMIFDDTGDRLEYALYPAVIRSRARLTYTRVAGLLERNERIPEYDGGILRTMNALAKVLTRRRMKRGALDLDVPEAQVHLDDDGCVTDIRRHPRTDAHRLIEEFMLAANESVAEYMLAHELPAMYRIHEPPFAADMEELLAVLNRMGFSSRRKQAKRKKREPSVQHVQSTYDEILEWAAGRADEDVIQMLVLRSLTQARYASTCEGHFGLATEDYLHFTSPIRRYPDFFVHQSLWRHWTQTGAYRYSPVSAHAGGWPDDIEAEAGHASVQERRAEEAEREMNKIKAARLMHTRLGEVFSGRIGGIIGPGIFVTLDAPFVEGFIATDRLPPDEYLFDEIPPRLKGRRTGRTFRLGDRVSVRVVGASIARRRIDLELA